MNEQHLNTLQNIIEKHESKHSAAHKNTVLNELEGQFNDEIDAQKAYADAYMNGYIYEPKPNKVRVVL